MAAFFLAYQNLAKNARRVSQQTARSLRETAVGWDVLAVVTDKSAGTGPPEKVDSPLLPQQESCHAFGSQHDSVPDVRPRSASRFVRLRVDGSRAKDSTL